jgi:uncharacterized protein with ATP-grasp and redox domains
LKLSASCALCILGKTQSLYNRFEPNEAKRLGFAKEAMGIICESDKEVSIPYLTYLLMSHLGRITETEDFYEQEKKYYNRFLLSMEDDISAKIDASPDPLLSALRYAMAGNYIDFGALDKVSKNELLEMLESVDGNVIKAGVYHEFKKDLGSAKSLVYLFDNAGEIVLDKLFVATMKKLYPSVKIHCVVRGLPVLNDATPEDAVSVGLDKLADVYGNGAAIPGTCIEYIADPLKSLILQADIVISKGQGNFESMYGCGLNVYYALLCKCDYFADRFRMERLSGVFINEKAIGEYVG